MVWKSESKALVLVVAVLCFAVGCPKSDDQEVGTESAAAKVPDTTASAVRAPEGERSGEDAPDEPIDVDVSGLVEAHETKARRAIERKDKPAAVSACESARELDEGACPWLAEEIADLPDQPPVEEKKFKFDPTRMPIDDTEGYAIGARHMVQGDWDSAINECERALAKGDERCRHILAVSYRNKGKKKKACEHYEAMNAVPKDGFCD